MGHENDELPCYDNNKLLCGSAPLSGWGCGFTW